MIILEGLYYSNEHEWVRVEGEKAYIGITDYAQHHLGDIVFVELPEMDEEVKAGAEIGVIESVKAVSTMFCPVGGIIVEINEALEESPELLNEDAYENYIAVVEMKDADDLKALLNAHEYEELCKKEEQEGK